MRHGWKCAGMSKSSKKRAKAKEKQRVPGLGDNSRSASAVSLGGSEHPSLAQSTSAPDLQVSSDFFVVNTQTLCPCMEAECGLSERYLSGDSMIGLCCCLFIIILSQGVT